MSFDWIILFIYIYSNIKWLEMSHVALGPGHRAASGSAAQYTASEPVTSI